MKRVYFAAALLALLLLCSLGLLWYCARLSPQLLRPLDRAAALAEQQDAAGAKAAFSQAETLWQQHQTPLSFFLDREKLGEITTRLAACRSALVQQSLTEFSVLCRKAESLLSQLFSQEFPMPENLL